MDPPLRTLLEPEARRPRGPASHRRRRSRQVRQARRIPRARQEEEEVNATTSPTEASYAVVRDTDTVRLQRTLPGPIELVCSTSDRKSVVSGKSVSVRVALGGSRLLKKK